MGKSIHLSLDKISSNENIYTGRKNILYLFHDGCSEVT